MQNFNYVFVSWSISWPICLRLTVLLRVFFCLLLLILCSIAFMIIDRFPYILLLCNYHLAPSRCPPSDSLVPIVIAFDNCCILYGFRETRPPTVHDMSEATHLSLLLLVPLLVTIPSLFPRESVQIGDVSKWSSS